VPVLAIGGRQASALSAGKPDGEARQVAGAAGAGHALGIERHDVGAKLPSTSESRATRPRAIAPMISMRWVILADKGGVRPKAKDCTDRPPWRAPAAAQLAVDHRQAEAVGQLADGAELGRLASTAKLVSPN